jgi:protein-S-isoprenylcysteine O-methyltransferase Ste14
MFDRLRNHRLKFSYVAAAMPILYGIWKRPHLIHWSLALIAAGVLMRVWAAGYITKDSILTQSGPYAMTRNPLYFGTFLSGLGLFVLVQAWILLAIFIPLFWLFYGGTIASEQRFLGLTYGEEYESYRRRVPIFFPRITPAKAPQVATFSLEKAIFHNKEIISMACTAVEVGLVYLTVCLP